ncbi:hypothetical protein [Methylobacterium crusticola]|uniref:hypothetical protein n=1 Tax=Methylobacterium crusticola TaxID=1697972 RepID=UPI000FFC8480|nr:hypothetical protein [Methylobacterium crusticola]
MAKPTAQRRPSASAPTKGAQAVARIEAQALTTGARPAPVAPARPVVTIQAATHRGRVASDFPNADAFILAPTPGGMPSRIFAELLRRRAAAVHADIFAGEPEARAWRRDVAREDLRALADLYEHCPTLYPVVTIRESDGLAINGDALRAAVQRLGGGSSPALACVEG